MSGEKEDALSECCLFRGGLRGGSAMIQVQGNEEKLVAVMS